MHYDFTIYSVISRRYKADYTQRYDGEDDETVADEEVESHKGSEHSKSNEDVEEEESIVDEEEGEEDDEDEGEGDDEDKDKDKDTDKEEEEVEGGDDAKKLSQVAESDEDMYTDDEPLRYACLTTDVFDLRANNHTVRSGK